TKEVESAFPDLYGFAFEDCDKYFRFMGDEKNPGYFCINPSIVPKMAGKVVRLFQNCKALQDEPIYGKLQEMRTHALSDFQKQISSMTYEWVKRVKSPAFFYANRIDEIRVGDTYSLKKISEPKSKNDRELLIKYFINDLVLGPFCFGNGNCQSMAELAFLLAIQQLSSTPLRCVQFQDGAGKYEVLNAIIVGDWPKGNCTVLAPWYSKKPFAWKGNLEATPEIKHYSISKVLFTIKDAKEQKMWQQFLQKSKFDVNELLKSPNRITYLKFIREQSQALYDLSQTLQQPEVEHSLKME
ncbi:MAG: hypothetical protein M3R00_05570, partial [Pseudomonadota bacterium]|nr:hypothetical protein [Pseudomonadota bacterium]